MALSERMEGRRRGWDDGLATQWGGAWSGDDAMRDLDGSGEAGSENRCDELKLMFGKFVEDAADDVDV